jgi:hypothetical protein
MTMKKVKSIPPVHRKSTGPKPTYLPILLEKVKAHPGEPYMVKQYHSESAGSLRKQLKKQLVEAGEDLNDWTLTTRYTDNGDGTKGSVLYAQYR